MATIGRKSGKGDTLYIRYKKDGTQRYKSTGTTDPQEAQKQLAQFLKQQEFERLAKELGHGTVPSNGQVRAVTDPYEQHRKRPIAEHIEAWAKSRRGRMTDKQVDESRAKILRIVEGAKIKTLADWSEERVEAYCVNLKKLTTAKEFDAKKAKPATLKTRNFYRQMAKAFDTWLYQRKRQSEPALRGLSKERSKDSIPSRQRPPLDMAEIQKLWASVRKSEKVIERFDGPTRYMLYLTTAATGYRRKELSSLTPESFRLAGEFPEIEVPGRMTKNGDPAFQPLPHYLVPVFTEWLTDKPVGQSLFPNLEVKDTAKMMKQDLEEAGMKYNEDGSNEYRDFHSWRHAFITIAWTAEDVTALTVRDLARHADIATTLGYSHTVSKQLHDAANSMARLPLPVDE